MKKIEKAFEVLKFAIENKVSLPKACEKFGQKRNFVSNVKLSIEHEVTTGTIKQEEWEVFSALYSKWKNINEENNNKDLGGTVNNKTVFDTYQEDIKNLWKDEEGDLEDRIYRVDYDAEVDADFDERSASEIVRDDEGKIVKYTYRVMVRGQKDLVGEFSREEMDKVYRLYSSLDGAGLTQRNIVREFPHLDIRDFKRILRAFNITKQSIPVAPHILEENSTDKLTEIVFRNKESNLLKKLEQERNKYFEKEYYKIRGVLEEEKLKNTQIKKIINEAIKDVNFDPINIKIENTNKEVALMIYLSDMHVGAHNDPTDTLFSSPYNSEVFKKRLAGVLNKIADLGSLYQRFDSIYICNLGDNLDGFNGQTTRGGHPLPQNMDNRQQFTIYVSEMLNFFNNLHTLNVSNNIHFVSVADCNHSGDFGYTSNWTLNQLLELKFPDIKLRLFEHFIEHVEYGKHCFIMTHGKDKQFKKHGFPMNLDSKTELFFADYINKRNVDRGKFLSVVKADLHSNNSQEGKLFRYRNTMSLYGGSSWIDANFGYTKPGVSFDIVSKNEQQILEGWISL